MHTYILYICNNTYVYYANIYIYIYIHHISSMCLLCLPCVYVCIYIYVCVRVYVQRKARFLFYCTLLLEALNTGRINRRSTALSVQSMIKSILCEKKPAIKFTVLGETSKHIHFPLPFFVLLVSLNVVERISRFHCHISFSGNRQNISFPEIAIFHCHIYIYFIAI